VKVYNLFHYSDYSLDFWGSFSSELFALDRIVSHIKKLYEFQNNSFEEFKQAVKFESTKEKEKILNDQKVLLNEFNNIGSIKDIPFVIDKIKRNINLSLTSLVYPKKDESVFYYRFDFLFIDKFSNENTFRIIEAEINEEIDTNLYN